VVPRAAPTAERLTVELVSFCGSGAACVSRGEAGKFAQSVGLAFFSRCFAIAALLGAVAAFPDEAKKNYELAEQLPISDPKDGQPMTLIIMSPAPLHQSDGIITQARQCRAYATTPTRYELMVSAGFGPAMSPEPNTGVCGGMKAFALSTMGR